MLKKIYIRTFFLDIIYKKGVSLRPFSPVKKKNNSIYDLFRRSLPQKIVLKK